MASVQKITLSGSRDIPFNKLLISQSNVRRIKAGVSIEELAEDIARRTLLQSLTVRPVRDADGVETGLFEIPAGGRRYRALELLVRQKRLAKTALVPCVIREDGVPEEDSLAENVQRAPLHPLDQFRAFLALREKGQSEEEIAAAFFVSAAVVKQRLRLPAVSPMLLEVYAEDGITLDQLMAFTVSGDHARQEQVFERLSQSHSKEPHVIRRMLTESAVRAIDKRAQFVGLEAYTAAGGTVMRDLFQGDDGGWLQDAGLLDGLVADKLRSEAEAIRAEGWKWIEIAPDFSYGHTYGLRQLRGQQIGLGAEEQATRAALQAEYGGLEESYADVDELPEEVFRRLGEIESAMVAIDERPVTFDREDFSRAGAFVSIDGEGKLRVERGYVRREDERPVAPRIEPKPEIDTPYAAQASYQANPDGQQDCASISAEPEEDEGLKPLPDRLMTELTAHRTLALRHALGEQPDVAFLAALHALCLKLFYHYALDTCLELDVKNVGFGAQAPGLNDSPPALAIEARHRAWVAVLPIDSAELWNALTALNASDRLALFAHCVSLCVNAVHEAYNRRPRALAHADRLAEAVDLDMVAAGWTPTAESFLGRVTKARILDAVREARGEHTAQRIDHLKKSEMVAKAKELLIGSGWLPEPLRTPGRQLATTAEDLPDVNVTTDEEGVQSAAVAEDTAVVDLHAPQQNDSADIELPAMAAE